MKLGNDIGANGDDRLANASFPLTLALSLGEREGRAAGGFYTTGHLMVNFFERGSYGNKYGRF